MRAILAMAMCGAVLQLSGVSQAAVQGGVLTRSEVQRVVADYVSQRTANLGVEVRVKSLGFPGDVALPPGSVSYEVASPREWEGWGRGALALIVRVNDRVEKNIPLTVEVEALADMVVSTRPLELGAVVGPKDVAVQKRDLAAAPPRVCRSLDEALGKRVRVGMRGNAPVRCDFLEKPAIVRSGQPVTIVAESGTFRITASGRARGNGAEGDRVIVQNLSSQKEVSAVVVDVNTVKVEF